MFFGASVFNTPYNIGDFNGLNTKIIAVWGRRIQYAPTISGIFYATRIEASVFVFTATPLCGGGRGRVRACRRRVRADRSVGCGRHRSCRGVRRSGGYCLCLDRRLSMTKEVR
jgi:hypothetical protein